MRNGFKVLICFAFSTLGIAKGVAQVLELPPVPKQVYVETTPNATLYEIKKSDSYFITSYRRVCYDTSSMRQKKVKKPTQYEIVDFTNINKDPKYDAYIVDIKDKYYIISASDIVDNTPLDERNATLERLHKNLKEEAERYSPSIAYNGLMEIVDARIKTCTDSARYLRKNQKQIIEARARKDATKQVEEWLQKYKERRESYYNWVSTLPASVQKDAKVLAIPESYIDVGYVGLCDYKMRILNMSKKTIKYLTWNGKVKNTVGDYISCEVRHTSSFSGKYTGPCYSMCDDFAGWDAVLYNGSADQMVLTSVKIIYIDGSSITIGKQSLDYITNIPHEVFFNEKIRFSFLGYSMESSYEDGVDMDVEVKNKLFLNGSQYERDLNEEVSKQLELERNYEDVKKFLRKSKGAPSRYNVRSVSHDTELMRAIDNYSVTLKKNEEVSANLTSFEARYFDFLK